MTINEIGGSVASVWEGLRPVTKKMLVGALRSGTATPKTPKFSYDAHADWEVSRLLTALDEQSKTSEVRKDKAKLTEINQLADTCVLVLESQSASAEVFIQLAERAIKENNYNRLDSLADHLDRALFGGGPSSRPTFPPYQPSHPKRTPYKRSLYPPHPSTLPPPPDPPPERSYKKTKKTLPNEARENPANLHKVNIDGK